MPTEICWYQWLFFRGPPLISMMMLLPAIFTCVINTCSPGLAAAPFIAMSSFKLLGSLASSPLDFSVNPIRPCGNVLRTKTYSDCNSRMSMTRVSPVMCGICCSLWSVFSLSVLSANASVAGAAIRLAVTTKAVNRFRVLINEPLWLNHSLIGAEKQVPDFKYSLLTATKVHPVQSDLQFGFAHPCRTVTPCV